MIAALDEAVPQSGEWKTFDTYSLLTTVSARATAYAIVGPELARNPEWIKLAVEATMTIFGASNAIRDAYAPHWRWLAKYRSEAPKRVRELRAKAKELIAPVYATRLEAFKKDGCDDLGDDITGKFVDTIYWLLGNKGAEKSLSAIADQEVFLTITSVHTTSGTMHSVLFDWLAHPEIHEDIRAECRDVLLEATDANGRVRWTTQLLAKLRKLDSFMKESARMHPIGFSKYLLVGIHLCLERFYSDIRLNSHRTAIHAKKPHLQRRPFPPQGHHLSVPIGRSPLRS